MTPYVSFLLDLAGSGASDNPAVRLVDGTIRFEPSGTPRPKTAFEWKISVNTSGLVTVRELRNGKLVVIATAEHRDGTLAEHHQRDPRAPTAYQWNLVEATVVRATAMAASATSPPAKPQTDDDPSVAERRALIRTPPEVLAENESIAIAAQQVWVSKPARIQQRRKGIAVGFALCGLFIVGLVMFIARSGDQSRPAQPVPETPVSRTPAPETAGPPITGNLVPDAAVAAAPTIETAPSFAEALALARPELTPQSPTEISPGAAALARYRRLQWSDVAGENETTLGLMAKDAEAEMGKRICIEGTLNRIQRRDIEQPGEPPRRVYTGGIHVDGEDDVWFVVAGSTGSLVRRSRAKLCGVVTGMSLGVPAVFGMFDLPENAQPIVEK